MLAIFRLRRASSLNLIRLMVIVAALLFAWWALVFITNVPHFILPAPQRVFVTLWELRSLLFSHFLVTLLEIVGGLMLGVILGFLFAINMQLFRLVRLWLLPVLLFSQAVPVFALAPILVLWLGYGMFSKVVMAAIIIFFPVLMTCFDGLRNTPTGYLDLAKTMNVKPWQMVWRIRFPAALPVIASGLRMAVVVAPIGAIIGEWVGSGAGLGYYMLHSNARMQVAEMFAALLVLACLSISLYYLADWLLKKWIPWGQG
ncbi:ABC transporter permease [Marinomonas algarum]|uniref:ABC transporter permease n=1 Tax=Marinomonas algarum TaxID=2883105 RepID=A0A9X1IKE6_9GAMM|nr:ABC transporter permease [Marinomonas algarum]MCB5160878.1 ABC transporter permease [Marinomonas algarum]